MESKTKHRILGVIVIIAIVIILLPFFQSTKETQVNTPVLKPPPFPEQPSHAQNEVIPLHTEAEVKQQPDDIIHTTRPAIIHTNKDLVSQHASVIDNPPSPKLNPVTKKKKPIPISPMKINKVKKPLPLKQASDYTSMSPITIGDNGLYHFKNSAWVVEVGSFKNKDNALGIVNLLRANGYKAFFQQVNTAMGETTRVFVGPEIKQKTARALASRIETDMKLHGIVLSYKPFSL